MGIGSWFGFGDKSARASEPQPEPAHKVPTSQDLLDAVDRVEQQAKDGKAPGMVGGFARKPFDSSQKAVSKSGQTGRKGRSKAPF